MFFTCFYKFIFFRNQYSFHLLKQAEMVFLLAFPFFFFFIYLNPSINVWHKRIEQNGCIMTPNMFILERTLFKVLSHVDLSRSRTPSQHKGFWGYVFNIPHINTSKLKYFKSNQFFLCFNTLMDLKQKQCATSPFVFY